jgi:hypothetical protein
LEILLTKAPTADEAELVPWLKTVVIRTIVQPLASPSSKDRPPAVEIGVSLASGRAQLQRLTRSDTIVRSHSPCGEV